MTTDVRMPTAEELQVGARVYARVRPAGMVAWRHAVVLAVKTSRAGESRVRVAFSVHQGATRREQWIPIDRVRVLAVQIRASAPAAGGDQAR